MIKVCIICGKEYKTNRDNQKTCSPECFKEHRRIYKAEFARKKCNSKTTKPVRPKANLRPKVQPPEDELLRDFIRRCAILFAKEKVAKLYPDAVPVDTLAQKTKEAAILGMSYGYYSALLRAGNTFEQLAEARHILETSN